MTDIEKEVQRAIERGCLGADGDGILHLFDKRTDQVGWHSYDWEELSPEQQAQVVAVWEKQTQEQRADWLSWYPSHHDEEDAKVSLNGVKPCPFCGVQEAIYLLDDEGYCHLECQGCGATGGKLLTPGSLEDKVRASIAGWNTRTMV